MSRIIVTGTMLRDAEARCLGRDGNQWCVLLPVLATPGMPIEARVDCLDVNHAQGLAALWRRGMPVTVEGSHVQARLDHSFAAVLLLGCGRPESA